MFGVVVFMKIFKYGLITINALIYCSKFTMQPLKAAKHTTDYCSYNKSDILVESEI